MNILNKVISKANSIKIKNIIESIPKTFVIHLPSNKTFFNKSNISPKNNFTKDNILRMNSLNKYPKFNMTTSNVLILINKNYNIIFLLDFIYFKLI